MLRRNPPNPQAEFREGDDVRRQVLRRLNLPPHIHHHDGSGQHERAGRQLGVRMVYGES